MADVTGAISSLPGSVHKLPHGADCDYCDNPATIRIQGETDSFGAEMIDLCTECHVKVKEEIRAERETERNCDWCKNKAKLSPIRDIDEGMSGPVYNVCKNCRDKQNDAIQEELDYYDSLNYGEEW